MYKLLIKEKESMKWRLKNIIIFNYSNNKKFSILTILLYIYVYRNPKIRPRRVREENHPRLLQFPIPKNPREPYSSSPMPKKIRVYSNGGRSARSCIQIGVLVTRTIFHENISGGGGGGGRSRRSLRGFPRFSSSDRPPPASQYFSNFLSRSYGTRSIMTSREQSFRPSCSLFALQHPYNRAHRFPASLLLPPSFCLLLSTFPFSLSLVLIQVRLGSVLLWPRVAPTNEEEGRVKYPW